MNTTQVRSARRVGDVKPQAMAVSNRLRLSTPAFVASAKPQAGAPRVDGWRAIRFFLVVAVALYLVFCHGCHRDQDNELFINAEANSCGWGR
jgi:hypothetical protein